MKFGRPELIWSIINFVIFVAVMTRLLYRPVIALLDDRAKTVKHQRERAERDRADAERLRSEAEAALSALDQRSHEAMVTAAERARETEERALAEARATSEKLLASARERAEQERELALAGLRREVGDLVITAAQRTLERSLDERIQHELIAEAIAALGAGE